MVKNAIFITDDIDNNEKITHMFTADHGFIPGNITVHDQIHKLDFTTKPEERSLFAFDITDNCDSTTVDVESCISKEYAAVSVNDMVYKGKKAYHYASGENPVQYILADIENNVTKMKDDGRITIYIQSDQMNVDDGSSVNTLSAPVHPGSISTPVAIQIDEPHEIQTALATAIQIAELI